MDLGNSFFQKKCQHQKNKVWGRGLKKAFTLLRPKHFSKVSEMDLEDGSWKLMYSNKKMNVKKNQGMGERSEKGFHTFET